MRWDVRAIATLGAGPRLVGGRMRGDPLRRRLPEEDCGVAWRVSAGWSLLVARGRNERVCRSRPMVRRTAWKKRFHLEIVRSAAPGPGPSSPGDNLRAEPFCLSLSSSPRFALSVSGCVLDLTGTAVQQDARPTKLTTTSKDLPRWRTKSAKSSIRRTTWSHLPLRSSRSSAWYGFH